MNNCKLCGKPMKNNRRKRCGACNTKIRRVRCKIAAVAYLGGKCRCGYEGNIVAFEFHHLDPTQKEFTIGNVANKSWTVIKTELDKCILLCSNCHRIEHADRDEVFMEEVSKYKGQVAQ